MKLTKLLTILILSLALAFSMTVFAQSLDEPTDDPPVQTAEITDNSRVIHIRNKRVITGESLLVSSIVELPIVRAGGTTAGGITLIISAIILAVTAADLAYLGVPSLRPKLNPSINRCLVSDAARECVPVSQSANSLISAIFAYFKKRSLFITFSIIGAVLLTSSILMGYRLNFIVLLINSILRR